MTWGTEWWKPLPRTEYRKKDENKRSQPKRPLEQHYHMNIHIIGIPGGQTEKGTEKIFRHINS